MAERRHRGAGRAEDAGLAPASSGRHQGDAAPTGASCILVGTYWPEQMRDWVLPKGYYNYPIRAKAEETIPAERLAQIKELWLYNHKTGRKCFAAEFVRVATNSAPEFDGYPAGAKQHGAGGRYFLFKVTPLAKPSAAMRRAPVVVRLADFAHDDDLKAGIKKVYLGGNATDEEKSQFLGRLLPADVCKCGCKRLKACAKAVQLDFLENLTGSVLDAGKIKSSLFAKTTHNKLLLELLQQARPSLMPAFTHLDCFSGVGGFCTGLHASGFRTCVAIEKVKSCVDTYVCNHPSVHVINNDIRKVKAKDILPFCPVDGIDLVTSGMPCETFSTAGNTSRSFYDDRQFLFREGIRVAQITRAKFLLFENVPAITTKRTGKNETTLIVDVLKDELVKAGYVNYIEVVLDATRFGVPQRRKRYFILGTRLNGLKLRKPSSLIPRAVTVGEAFADLPPVTPNSWQEGDRYLSASNQYTELMRNGAFWKRESFQSDTLSYQMPMKHRPATLERFALLRPGDGLKELFERFSGRRLVDLQSRRVLPKKMFIKRNYRLPSNQPSPTVTSHCLDEFVHPVENRALTVRECARLQSFPDSYDFKGGPYIVPHINREVQDKYEQIGDAVPPLLAYAWGNVISEMLQETEE